MCLYLVSLPLLYILRHNDFATANNFITILIILIIVIIAIIIIILFLANVNTITRNIPWQLNNMWQCYLHKWGRTSLITAIQNSDIEVTRFLLQLGANVEAKNKVRESVFIFVIPCIPLWWREIIELCCSVCLIKVLHDNQNMFWYYFF